MRRAAWQAAAAVAVLISASLASGTARAASAPETGTWSIDARTPGHLVQLTLSYRTEHGSDEESNPVAYSASGFPGLTSTQLAAADTQVKFDIVRDAGSFECEGVFRSGLGSGVFTFVRSDAFAAALQSRGIGAPSDAEQFELAMSGMTLATIDMLRSQGVTGLSSSALVRLGDHGVDDTYIRSLAQYGVKPSSVDDYVRLADHGVEPKFVAGLLSDGYHPSIDDLVRLCDHGVTLDFIANLRTHGYHPSIDDLIRLRDSGMSAAG
jgi:hypothetical protein